MDKNVMKSKIMSDLRVLSNIARINVIPPSEMYDYCMMPEILKMKKISLKCEEYIDLLK